MTNSRSPFREPHEKEWLALKTRPTRILFLDDDVNLCQVMEAVCAGYHTQLTIAHTIKEAIEIATKHQADAPFDVMILDVRVSNGTGMEFYAYVMERWPRTHVVFVTGYDSAEVRHRIEEIGPARVHQKSNVMRPVFMQALFAQWGLTPIKS